MRIAIAFALLLLIGGGASLFYDSFVPLLVAAVVFFSRRFAGRFVWDIFVVPLMPEWARHAYFSAIRALKRAAVLAFIGVRMLWIVSPWPVRAALVLASALAAGLTAFILLVIPVPLGKVPFIGPWLREIVMPYLLRTATAKSIEMHVPEAWRRIPLRLRRTLSWPYMRLWRFSARWAVRTRQAIGRRSLLIERHVVRGALPWRYY